MALQVQGRNVVRKKIAAFKSNIQVAERRTENAKQSLRAVQERFNQTMEKKANLEELIHKRDTQLDRVQAEITNTQRKWNAMIRFCEEINLLVPGDYGELACKQVEQKLNKFIEQTKNVEKRYRASVERERDLVDQTKKSHARCIRLETSVRALQEQLTTIREGVHILEQRRREKVAMKHKTEALQEKVNQLLARAHEMENVEAELEGRIFELEDKIEMYVQKTKRASSMLADTDNHRSIDSWAIAVWLRKSNLIANPTSIRSISIGVENDA